MVEQQLVDYIKKARQARQKDEETRSLLYKNGWTEEEISEAFLAVKGIISEPEPQLEQKFQPASERTSDEAMPEHQVSGQPEIKIQPEGAVQSQAQYQPRPTQQPQYQNQPMEPYARQKRGWVRFVLKFLIILTLLVAFGGGIYFLIGETNFLKNIINEISSYFSTPKVLPSETVKEKTQVEKPSTQPLPVLETKNIASVPQEYDAAKITFAAFDEKTGRTVYCAPLKTDGTKTSCFLNGQKILENPYSFKPYWVGVSPNGQRIIFIYYDSVKKQSFIFENGKEGVRHEGIINFPNFSQDSQNFMFIVMANDGKNFVVLNDKAGVPYDKIFTIPEISSDGRYIVYGARNGQDMFWVADKITSYDKTAEETETTTETDETEETINETE